MFISFIVMRLRERRLPQSTEAAGLQASKGLNDCLEAVHRRQQSQNSRSRRWHCPQHRYHLPSALRSSVLRAALQAPWGCKGLSPHSSKSSSRSSCSQCTPAANNQRKTKRERAHPAATAGGLKHCLQSEMTIFSCPPNCLTSLLPVLLADSHVADALILS